MDPCSDEASPVTGPPVTGVIPAPARVTEHAGAANFIKIFGSSE